MTETLVDQFDPKDLGPSLRRHRQERGITVRGLAREIGCSPSLVSQIERGLSAPSVGILYRMANALCISMDDVFADVDSQTGPEPNGQGALPDGRGAPSTTGADSPVRPEPLPPAPPEVAHTSADAHELLRRLPPSSRVHLQRAGERRAIEFANGVQWHRLTPTADPRADFLETEYPPGSASDEVDSLSGHPGYEYGVVIEGALTVQIDGDEYVLRPGDAISFDSHTPHRYRNDTSSVTRAIWCVLHEPC